jgi:molybdopterin biosynthesis enzyme
MPAPQWREAGEAMPQGADAVAPVDAVVWRGDVAEAVAPVTPGEGVLAAGADMLSGMALMRSGMRLRRSDIAVLMALDIAEIAVRVPRIALVLGGPADALLDAAMGFVADRIAASGCVPKSHPMEEAFRDPRIDAVIVIGGTGTGRRDASVRALARSGRVAVHGVAISPGESAALGEVDGRPVLLIPGRLDSALAVWLLLGRPLLARLAGCDEEDEGREVLLARKIASSLGLAEVVLVGSTGVAFVPVATGYLSLAAIANADGWVLVPPESEGYPAGRHVTVRPLP